MRAKAGYATALLLAAVLSGLPHAHAAATVPAFRGAEGFGAHTVHARGKTVCKVTRLDDIDDTLFPDALVPGQLRHCLRRATELGGAYIVFDVSGTIVLARVLQVPSHVYIAGQSSPGGIAIEGAVVEIKQAHDVLIRHVRHREAAPRGDAFRIRNAHHVVLDHVSVSFFKDGAVDIVNDSHDISIQWSHMGDAMQGGDPLEPYHGEPNLLRTGVDRVSLHHNFYTHGHSRMPLLTEDCKPGILIEFSNNVVYNFRKTPSVFKTPRGRGNVIGNFYIPGANTYADSPAEDGGALLPHAPVWGANGFALYVRNNLMIDGLGHDGARMAGPHQGIGRGPAGPVTGARPHDDLDEALIMGVDLGKFGPVAGVLEQLPERVQEIPPVTTQPARENLDAVISQFGALPRDATDQRLVHELLTRSGQWRFDKPHDDNRYTAEPVPDTDGDGLPDEFEAEHGGNLEPGGHDLDPVYDNIEVYLDRRAEALLEAMPALSVDLGDDERRH